MFYYKSSSYNCNGKYHAPKMLSDARKKW